MSSWKGMSGSQWFIRRIFGSFGDPDIMTAHPYLPCNLDLSHCFVSLLANSVFPAHTPLPRQCFDQDFSGLPWGSPLHPSLEPAWGHFLACQFLSCCIVGAISHWAIDLKADRVTQELASLITTSCTAVTPIFARGPRPINYSGEKGVGESGEHRVPLCRWLITAQMCRFHTRDSRGFLWGSVTHSGAYRVSQVYAQIVNRYHGDDFLWFI